MFLFTILILIAAVGLGALTVILVNKKPELRKVFQSVYAVLIVLMIILLIARITQPINFKKERAQRENTAIEQLKQIRTVQEAFKDKYGKYTGSFDTLFTFVNADSFTINKIELAPGAVWKQDDLTKEQALRQGILKKSVSYIPVRDSLFAPEDVVEDLKYIPFTNNEEVFEMGAGEVETGSQVKVKVFEAYALYDILFNGMDRQEVINYKDRRYKIIEFEGVKVGSLTEANNNAGNWEK